MRKKSNHRGHRGTRGTTQGTPDATRASSAKGKLAEDIRRRFAVLADSILSCCDAMPCAGSQDFGRDHHHSG